MGCMVEGGNNVQKGREMRGIPHEKPRILASATMFPLVADPGCGKSKSALRLGPLELIRFARPVLWNLLSQKFSFAPISRKFWSTFSFPSSNLDVSSLEKGLMTSGSFESRGHQM